MLLYFLILSNILKVTHGTSSLPFFLQDNVNTSVLNLKQTDFFTSLNISIKPCVDFYQFSCGRWQLNNLRPSYEPSWSHWQIVTYRISNRLQAILQDVSHKSDPALQKVGLFYKACVKVSEHKNEYFFQMLRLIEHFKGWPLVQTNPAVSENYSWIADVARITRSLNIHPILKMYSAVDFKNTTRNILYIESGNFIVPQSILLDLKQYKGELDSYKHWILETVKHLYNKSDAEVEKQIIKIIKFEINLAKLSFTFSKKRRMTIGELTNTVPINWLEILKHLLGGANNLDDNTFIVVDIEYVINLFQFIHKTDKVQIANYLIWNIVKEMSRETTTHLRHLSFAVDKAIFGIEADIPREHECINKIIKYMSFPLVPEYVDTYLHPKTLSTVKEMISNIKKEFVKMLEKSSWMTHSTKLNSIEKINSIKQLLGYPKWAMRTNLLSKFYEKLNITENHFSNMIRIKQFISNNNLENFNKPAQLQWPSSPFEVNAYYSILQNIIIIPLGLLEPPFFDIKRLTSINYGALGSLIGHEISHSLDTVGRLADKNGNFVNWWHIQDVLRYKLKTRCFKKQFHNSNQNIHTSMAEVIADNTGIKISLMAYKNLKAQPLKQNAIFSKTRSENKLFFISFAQMWCEMSTESEFVNDYEHSPVQMRVKKTLLNNKDFAKEFGCKQRKNICEMW